eukprot:2296907-Alexandrium_andersonii.AAC.1
MSDWSTQPLVGDVTSALDRARKSRDVAFVRSAVASAQRSALPTEEWADVAQLLSVLEREEDLASGTGRLA